MPFSDKQQEFFRNANHRWNIKVGATRSGKTYMDYYVIPKRIRARAEKEGWWRSWAFLKARSSETSLNHYSVSGEPSW